MKKRLLFINTVIDKCSTGKIVANSAKEYEAKGYEVKIAYGRDSGNKELVERYGVRIGNNPDFYLHALYTRLTDNHGLGSKKATARFLKWADEYNPDILWLHNIHGYYINYELLFEWIKQRPFMEVKWTLHDCWAFTGHCAFFTYAKCDKWKKDGCGNCPQIEQYPMSLVDNSAMNYMRKRAAFTGIHDMTLITPSKWLKETEEDCKVYAVEIDEEAAKDASKYTEDILVGDIEKLEWLDRWENIEFDYIIFADVLEHLRNPMEVLKQTKCLLKDEGKVLLSVPNVAHNSILINLHRNIFSYTKVGILDDTHIHLFSYYSLKEMCSFAGYTPVVEDAIYIGVGDTEICNSYKDVSEGLEKELRSRKYGNVYQFYFTLQKTYQLNNFGGVTEYKIKQTAPGYFFQVFTDRGCEYCEENSVKISTTAKGYNKFQVNLDDVGSIRAIRIDPLDCSCIVADMSIELDCGDNKYRWNYGTLELNGFRFAERVVFDNDDPQVIINNIDLSGEQSGVLTVSLRYVDVGISREIAEELKAIGCEIEAQKAEAEARIAAAESIVAEIKEAEITEQASNVVEETTE